MRSITEVASNSRVNIYSVSNTLVTDNLDSSCILLQDVPIPTEARAVSGERLGSAGVTDASQPDVQKEAVVPAEFEKEAEEEEPTVYTTVAHSRTWPLARKQATCQINNNWGVLKSASVPDIYLCSLGRSSYSVVSQSLPWSNPHKKIQYRPQLVEHLPNSAPEMVQFWDEIKGSPPTATHPEATQETAECSASTSTEHHLPSTQNRQKRKGICARLKRAWCALCCCSCCSEDSNDVPVVEPVVQNQPLGSQETGKPKKRGCFLKRLFRKKTTSVQSPAKAEAARTQEPVHTSDLVKKEWAVYSGSFLD
ncbi:uncharacterized protein [Hoplias malabaricus]